MLNIEEIKVREQAATPGPWCVGDGTHQSLFNGKNAVIMPGGKYVVAERAVYPDSPHFNEQVFSNMAFIAHARTDIPELLAEVERQSEVISDLLHDKHDYDIENDSIKAKISIANLQIATLKKRLESTTATLKQVANKYVAKSRKNATLKKALKLMAKDFYDASDDEVHTGPDGLASDYIKWAEQLSDEKAGAPNA